MKLFIIFLLTTTGCTTTKVTLFCDGSESWVFTDCRDSECTDYEVKQCIGSDDGS